MCTVTWTLKKEGYEVFFNRDEQRSRAKAFLPVYYKEARSIMPIDPLGGGTWIAVNQDKVTLCLLNNYQISLDTKEKYCSRGLLIKELIALKGIEAMIQKIQKTDLSKYQPFLLCMFPEDLNLLNPKVLVVSWNGIMTQVSKAEQPITSSAKFIEKVITYRKSSFEKIVSSDMNDTQKHLLYHTSHDPEKSAFSVCMHRSDAKTQSLSYIIVNDSIVFSYIDGAPCSDQEWINISIPSDIKSDFYEKREKSSAK